MTLSLPTDATTQSYTTMSLWIFPGLSLPSDTAITISLSAYSSGDTSLSYLVNPVMCARKTVIQFQCLNMSLYLLSQQKAVPGASALSCEFNSSNQLVISSYLSDDQTAPAALEVYIYNFLTPSSSRPLSSISIGLSGSNSGRLIQEESSLSLQVTNVSAPKAIAMTSSSYLNLGRTTLTFVVQANVLVSSSFNLYIKFPSCFLMSQFSSDLVAYSSFQSILKISVINGQAFVISGDIVMSGTSDKVYVQLTQVKNYDGAYSCSDAFSLILYDDSTLTYQVLQDNSSLKYETEVSELEITSFTYQSSTVQTTTSYSMALNLSNGMDNSSLSANRLVVTLPNQLSFSSNMLSTMMNKGQISCNTLSSYITISPIGSDSKCKLETNQQLAVYGFYQANQANSIQLTFNSIVNPISSVITDVFNMFVEIKSAADQTTWYRVYQNNLTSPVTQVTPTSNTATISLFESIGSVTTSDLSTYSISIILSSSLPASSTIDISFPTLGFTFSSMTLTNCSCEFTMGLVTSKTQCLFGSSNNVTISIGSDQTVNSGAQIRVLLHNIKNPRSLAPTGNLSVATYSPNMMGIIDQSSNSQQMRIVMQASNLIQVQSVSPFSQYVGAKTNYNIQFISPSYLVSSDALEIYFSDIILLSTTPTCIGIAGLPTNIACTADLTSNILTISITVSLQSSTQIQFSVSDLRNPYSLTLTSPLHFKLKDNQGYSISTAYHSQIGQQTNGNYSFASAPMLSLSVTPQSLLVGKITTYSIQFSSPIPISSDNALIVGLSNDLQIGSAPVECYVLIKDIQQVTKALCQYNQATHIVIVTDFLAPQPQRLLEDKRKLASSSVNEGSVVQVTLTGIKNKISNGLSAGSSITCSISSFDQTSGIYDQLASSNYQLSSSFICSSPCDNCTGSSTTCTNCISDYYLLTNEYTCSQQCPSMYFKESPTKCTKCLISESDSHCTGCSSSLNSCNSCESKYKLIFNQSIGECQEITSENDPMRSFVYDLQYNLPYICIYLFIMTLITIIRRIAVAHKLRMAVTLLILFTLIELILLIVFTIKIILMQQLLLLIIALFILISHVVLQVIAARKISKSFQADSNYMLYSPSYSTIRVINRLGMFNNYKSMLLYRSQFSIIKDIYNIPFTNQSAHSFLFKRACQFSLGHSLLFLLFNVWVMIYLYNYRLVLIPPFFFIEMELFYLLITILLIILIFSKTNNINVIFDSENEVASKYKLSQLDIKQKSQSFMASVLKDLSQIQNAGQNSFSTYQPRQSNRQLPRVQKQLQQQQQQPQPLNSQQIALERQNNSNNSNNNGGNISSQFDQSSIALSNNHFQMNGLQSTPLANANMNNISNCDPFSSNLPSNSELKISNNGLIGNAKGMKKQSDHNMTNESNEITPTKIYNQMLIPPQSKDILLLNSKNQNLQTNQSRKLRGEGESPQSSFDQSSYLSQSNTHLRPSLQGIIQNHLREEVVADDENDIDDHHKPFEQNGSIARQGGAQVNQSQKYTESSDGGDNLKLSLHSRNSKDLNKQLMLKESFHSPKNVLEPIQSLSHENNENMETPQIGRQQAIAKQQPYSFSKKDNMNNNNNMLPNVSQDNNNLQPPQIYSFSNQNRGAAIDSLPVSKFDINQINASQGTLPTEEKKSYGRQQAQNQQTVQSNQHQSKGNTLSSKLLKAFSGANQGQSIESRTSNYFPEGFSE